MLGETTDTRLRDGVPVATVPAPRRLVFVSHANPEDNGFAAWLASQLAIAGYEVWCDVAQLLGGERFWQDIAEAIDAYAFRFLFVSTSDSNRKVGTLRELTLALEAQAKHGLKDFIVPLKVDQLPFASTQESVRNLNFVRFDESWAAGFAQLLSLLEREGALKSPGSGPACVSDWHRRSTDSRRQVVISNERCLTNWFRLKLPKHLRFHRYAGPENEFAGSASWLARPNRVHGGYLATFATSSEIRELSAAFPETVEVVTSDFMRDGDESLDIAPFDASNIVSDLVRQGWDAAMTRRGLCVHGLASGMNAWFLRDGYLPKNKAYFQTTAGRRAYRQLVGRKSRRRLDGTRRPDGFWHYAVSASEQLRPFPRMVLRHHVIFSDDGETPWSNADRMHRARRSVCKQWWNDAWRDRLLAFCAELGRGSEYLDLPVSGEDAIRMAMTPMTFVSPWTYFEDGAAGSLNESEEIELVEDENEEEADDGEAG